MVLMVWHIFYTLVVNMEQDMEMLHVTLSLPSEAIAKTMKENWPEKAQQLYAGLFESLGEQKS